MNFAEIVKQAGKLTEQKRFSSAVASYEDALHRFPQHSSMLSYSLGVIYQMYVGDGEKARELFRQSIEQRNASEGIVQGATLDTIESNACENLMLLSLSYEEYYSYAKRLVRLQPQNAILHQQKPAVLNMQERGLPWSAVLSWMASAYFSLDLAKDAGRYGNAVSTYHLLILHRKELRLRREDWRIAILGYAATTLSAFFVCGQYMERAFGKVEQVEFAFVVEKSLLLVEEYVDQNPNDQQAQQSLSNLRKALEVSARSLGDSVAAETSAANTLRRGKQGTLPVLLLGAVAGAIYGHFLLVQLGPPWDVVIGGIAGLIMLGTAWYGALEIVRQIKQYAVSSGSACEPQPITVSPPGIPIWQISSSLTEAIARMGLRGYRFQFLGTNVEGGELTLTFRALTPVPKDKVHEAGLALRCLVWLSLPSVVSYTQGIQVEGLGQELAVCLGDGVPVPILAMKMGGDHTPPLQCTSDEKDSRWEVHVKPLVIAGDDFNQQVEAQNRIFEALRPAFNRLKEKPVSLDT